MFNIIIAGIASMLTDISTEMVYPLLPLYLASLGTQPAILGLIEGVAESSASLIKLFSGRISDRFQRRKLLVLTGYSGSTLGKLLLYLSGNWILVFFGRLIDRIGKGIRVAPRDAIIADASINGTRGRAFGLHRAFDTLGATLGIAIAIFLISRLHGNPALRNYQQIFLLSIMPALLGVFVLFFLKETRTKKPTSPPALRIKNLPPPLRRFLLIIGMFAIGNSSNQFLLLRMNRLGWSTLNILILYFLYNLSYATLAFPAGKIADRIGKRKILSAGYLIYSAVYFGFALLDRGTGIALPYILFIAYGLFSALTEGLEKALVSDIAPENQRASMLGLHAAITGLGLLAASVLAGILWNLFGPRAPFIFSSVLGVGASIGLQFAISTNQIR
ncbi:MAG: MFS transporter [candidate division WOR-3 bacterium]